MDPGRRGRFGELDRDRGSLAEFPFEMDLPVVKRDNLLDQGEADTEGLEIAQGLWLFLGAAGKNLL